MTQYLIVRTKKLKSDRDIRGSGQHTWREIPTPNADKTRTHLNKDLLPISSSRGLLKAVNKRVGLATRKSREPVLAIEYLITASPGAWDREVNPISSTIFVTKALQLLENQHGAENVVAANLQLDEETPHLVAYVVPLIYVQARPASIPKQRKGTNGQLEQVSHSYTSPAHYKLSAAATLDGRAKLHALQNLWHEQFGRFFNLERGQVGSGRKHIPQKRLYQLSVAGNTPIPTIPPRPILPKSLPPKPVKPSPLATPSTKRKFEEDLSKWKELAIHWRNALNNYYKQLEAWVVTCENVTKQAISAVNKQRVLEEQLKQVERANTKLTKQANVLTMENSKLKKANSEMSRYQQVWEYLPLDLQTNLEEIAFMARQEQYEKDQFQQKGLENPSTLQLINKTSFTINREH